jgi:DNA-binding winged helix-turn-helix (wHTH) protein
MNDDVIYEFSGHRLDPARRQLSHGGKPVALFPRCFDALLLLVERRGELLDKDFLLHSWPLECELVSSSWNAGWKNAPSS